MVVWRSLIGSTATFGMSSLEGSIRGTVRVERHRSEPCSIADGRAIGSRLPPNASLLFVPNDVDGDYCRTIVRNGDHFDVVVVDGRDRVNCVKQSMQALSSRGVIVLDDSERAKYAPAISYAQENGYLTVDFEGLKPTDSSWCRSTILYRRENCLGL